MTGPRAAYFERTIALKEPNTLARTSARKQGKAQYGESHVKSARDGLVVASCALTFCRPAVSGDLKEWRNLLLLSLLFQISPSLGQSDMFSLAGYSDMKSKLVTSLR